MLVHFQQVLAIDVILPKELLILGTINASDPFANALLRPVLNGVGVIVVVEFILGRAGIDLSRAGEWGCSSRGMDCGLGATRRESRGAHDGGVWGL